MRRLLPRLSIRRVIQTLCVVLTVLAVLIAGLASYARARRRDLVLLQQQRFTSYQLAEELRNSSDDLTRFARTYVATGEAKYEQYYHDVLAIRNGELPRPEHYERIYWDLAVARGTPGPAGPPVSLLKLMEDAGFTPAELAQLSQAQARSDSLVMIEETAFHAIKGRFRDARGEFTRSGPPDQAFAIRIMFDSAYHRQKARIMAPIDSFLASVETRTAGELALFDQQSNATVAVIRSIIGLFVLSVLLAYPLLRARVLTPVSGLQTHTRMIATDIDRLAAVSIEISRGDLTQSFDVRSTPLRSVQGDEIGDLSQLHDAMLDRLQATGAAIATMTADLRRANQELENTIAKLREVEGLRDDLTHMIVHDMRSPLTVLLMQLQLMREEVTGDVLESIDEARKGAQQLNQLANTLLDVTRLEQGKMPLKRAPVDLAKLATDVRGVMVRMEAGRTIDLASAGEAIVSCDAGLVRRVLENLVSNAIKHTPAGGKIRIDVRSVGGRVRLAVQDEGEGVPPEARERIFQKFGAVAVRQDRAYHSVGLGLAFCKLAVEAHGGTIRVEPASPRGSVFVFELPA